MNMKMYYIIEYSLTNFDEISRALHEIYRRRGGRFVPVFNGDKTKIIVGINRGLVGQRLLQNLETYSIASGSLLWAIRYTQETDRREEIIEWTRASQPLDSTIQRYLDAELTKEELVAAEITTTKNLTYRH